MKNNININNIKNNTKNNTNINNTKNNIILIHYNFQLTVTDFMI